MPLPFNRSPFFAPVPEPAISAAFMGASHTETPRHS